MDILRLIISILIPPVGILINFLVGAENKIQKAAKYISYILTTAFIVCFVAIIVIIAGSNSADSVDAKCRKVYKCDKSDNEFQTCYYCRDDNCKRVDTVQCPNNYDDTFNYETIQKDGDDKE